MKKNLFFSLFILMVSFLPVKQNYAITLSNSSEISLLTCGPGEELYSIFGHSAVRICDPVNHIDRVYNYGTFDFGTEHFYLKFASGRLLYYLDTEEYFGFMRSYIYENRTIYEQTLNLDSITKQKLFLLLEENHKPKNRFYRYDFFYDNCTTRIRDILIKALDNMIDFKDYTPPPIPTFRKMISHYIKHLKWTDLGIDIIFGINADRKMTKSEYMFLPIELKNALDKAKITGSNVNLVKKNRILYTAAETTMTTNDLFSPFFVLWALFAFFVIITFIEIWKKFNIWIFDFLIFFITGLLGLLITSLMFGSLFTALSNNLVLLWAIPFHFIMAFFVARKNSKFVKYYFFLTFILMIILLISWFFLPQSFNIAVIPIVLLLALRSFKIFYFRSTEKTKRPNIYYK